MAGVLARPPKIHPRCQARRAAPVGLDQRPVDVHVRVAGHLRREQRQRKSRSLGCDHGEAFMQVGVPGRMAQGIGDSQLRDPGPVEQPAQDQDRVPGSSSVSGFRPWCRDVAARHAAGPTRTAWCGRVPAGQRGI